jgi:chemotaxis response regulator CheB
MSEVGVGVGWGGVVGLVSVSVSVPAPAPAPVLLPAHYPAQKGRDSAPVCLYV